ncbi:MAG: limonene-1,2-epoxide hydrolase family protein [Actinomycetota bacterium]
MADSPDSLVRGFIARLVAKDIEAAVAMVGDDLEYDNVPIGTAHGPDGLRGTLSGFFASCDQLDWQILRQTSTGDLARGTVLNERDDRLFIHGRWASLPVAGIFEIVDGRIVLWRDYFDRATLFEAMTPPTPAV